MAGTDPAWVIEKCFQNRTHDLLHIVDDPRAGRAAAVAGGGGGCGGGRHGVPEYEYAINAAGLRWNATRVSWAQITTWVNDLPAGLRERVREQRRQAEPRWPGGGGSEVALADYQRRMKAYRAALDAIRAELFADEPYEQDLLSYAASFPPDPC